VKWLRFPRVAGLVLVAYFAVVTAYFAYETARRSQFAADATTVSGIVVALEPRPLAGSTHVQAAGGDLPLAPQVRYEVAGRTYLYTAAHGKLDSGVRVGDALEVLYDPTNPEQARLRGEGQILLPVITAGFGTVTVLLVVVLVLSSNRSGLRAARRVAD
jgi:Protein of unknown function (DUF3592)